MISSSDFSRSNAQVIKYPIITDKATRLLENNQYSFVVDPSSDKVTIAFLYWGFQPIYFPTRFFLRGNRHVLILITFTLNKYSIAALIVILSEEGSTTKLY